MQWLVVCSVIAISVITYLPAIDNFFISDDFWLIPYVRALAADPLHILSTPSEFFRLVSYVCFWVFLQLFGTNPEPWYWSGIALHALASLLVFRLVFLVSGHTGAAWAAAAFFAAYERHQEAVMWISAFNDLILTVNCLLFMILWERALPGTAVVTRNYLAAVALFVVALFSKEGAVALLPLAALRLAFRGYAWREIARYTLPLLIPLAGYLALWLSMAQRNFFVADGHYELGLHFIPVYARTFMRLLSPVLLLLIPLGFALYRRGPLPGRTLNPSRGYAFIFFAAILVLSIVPYSFLTYLDHIPSRNVYLPSVGTAGLIGAAFAMLFSELQTLSMRRMSTVFLGVIIAGNVAYVWFKKEPQFLERSRPTRELVSTLNGMKTPDTSDERVHICGFPMPSWLGQLVVQEFTQWDPNRVVFAEHCDGITQGIALQWDLDDGTYHSEVMAVTD
jgi:hypothetical protein